jgi:undecaprenyl-diphosphatase
MTGLLIVCGLGITHSSAIMSMDRSISAFVVEHRTSALNQLMKAVTWTGSWLATLTVAVIVLALTLSRRVAVLATVAVLAAWFGELLAVTLTKAAVQRSRPPEAVHLVPARGWSFPSGHTANAVVVFASASAVITILAHRKRARIVTWVVATFVTVVVGFSRIELGVHWMTDVAASLVWTTCWLALAVILLRRVPGLGHWGQRPPS